MKKNILIISAIVLALILTAFAVMKKDKPVTALTELASNKSVNADEKVVSDSKDKKEPVFFHNIGSKFNSITKQELIKATSFADFIKSEHAGRILSYKSLSVSVLDHNNEQTEIILTNNSGILSPDQLEVLKSADFATNLLIKAEYTETSFHTGEIEDSVWTPYLTVVPETQATYINGNKEILNYLEEYYKEEIANLIEDKLEMGSLLFTVTKEGTISNIKVVSKSGVPSIDEKIKDLISKLPKNWQPAKTVNGDKTDQTFVISYGRSGC